MKIAFLTTDVREHIRDYQNRVATFGSAPEAVLQGFAGLPGIEVHVVSCARQRMTSQLKLAPNIWFHSLYVPKWGWMRTAYLGCILAVRRKLRELQPDLVHGQGTERDCALSAAFSGFPSLVTVHGHMVQMASIQRSKPFSFCWNAAQLERLALPRCRGVLCLSKYHSAKFQAQGLKTWVVPNAAAEDLLGLTHMGSDYRDILCVAHVQPWKNQNLLIHALEPLRQNTEFRVVFLGTASHLEDYGREFLDLVRSRPWCRHVGGASREQVKTELTQATLAILPSTEDNCPMAVIEAMAAQLPVAAARIGGVPDLIEHNVTGLLFNPHSVSEIAENVSSLLQDPGKGLRLARAARQFVGKNLRPESIANRHLEIYRELLAHGVKWPARS